MHPACCNTIRGAKSQRVTQERRKQGPAGGKGSSPAHLLQKHCFAAFLPQERGLLLGLTLPHFSSSLQCVDMPPPEEDVCPFELLPYKTSVLHAWKLSCQPEHLGFPCTHMLLCMFQANVPPKQHHFSRSCSVSSNWPQLQGQLWTLAALSSEGLPGSSPGSFAG